MNIDNIDFVKLGQLIKIKMSEKRFSVEKVANQIGINIENGIRLRAGLIKLSQSQYNELFNILEIKETDIPYKSIKEDNKTKTNRNKVFISYSHKDKSYLERLMVHLKPLEKHGLIDTWVDTRLMAGDRWKKEIEKALKNAKVGILLISADFLASDFIIDNELPPLLRSAEENGALIIPVILKPCRFLRDINLREFQAINKPNEPLCLVSYSERELTYDSLAKIIEDTFMYNG